VISGYHKLADPRQQQAAIFRRNKSIFWTCRADLCNNGKKVLEVGLLCGKRNNHPIIRKLSLGAL
jgi:hypothetical protein